MPSKKDFVEYIMEQLRLLEEIKLRPMMGEYLLYHKGKLFGGIYDERLLVKRTETNKKFNLKEEIPYTNAKPMYMISDLDDAEKIKEIVISTYEGLK